MSWALADESPLGRPSIHRRSRCLQEWNHAASSHVGGNQERAHPRRAGRAPGAGSMVMTPRIGEDFVGWASPAGGDETLGLVDFSIFPHLDNEDLRWNTMANAERWAAGVSASAYAIDDQTAIRVNDGTVDVVLEGHWKQFAQKLAGRATRSAPNAPAAGPRREAA